MIMPPEEHRQDRELALQAAGGDNVAWREIYEATCQPLFNFLCYQVGERETAKDLLQDTYLSALQNLERYRGDGSLLSWLRTIALRKCLDWRRSAWQRIKRISHVPETIQAPPPRQTEARLELTSVGFRRALAQLSKQQRAALLLRELEDLSFEEVAASLGCKEATARVHYHRGQQKLKKMLAEAEAPALAEDMGGQQI
jgi:RNA polymerase sigma-70 factor (ECF subfamily)